MHKRKTETIERFRESNLIVSLIGKFYTYLATSKYVFTKELMVSVLNHNLVIFDAVAIECISEIRD